ncbi:MULTISPECIES: hypothetical protein [Nitrosomonas]|uniref:Uncharacterized protein n=1 Tax=Nitrosomonas communis TaxID=44574 RepID=A0A0F7KFC2_9PROT|nr:MULTISPECIES: hypothetical protein [Nitrosomonas]AKH37559.1 hypothetical protein AAW31_06585 [Nitrosomonas communis]TYP78478.1 hypothetical protein BCL69_107210 [Nitrosomonas communis]UVS62820.1 hypothetical protein NX761_06850 [Nitrosomonas sp. PLL12]
MKSTSKPRKSITRKEWVKHWCPPRPLAGLEAVEKIMNRHVQVTCPESRLVVAVIALAIQDCLDRSDSKQRHEARRFILGPGLQHWCDLVGLHVDFVRAIARKAGYLASEEHHWQRVSSKALLTKPVANASKPSIPPIICY